MAYSSGAMVYLEMREYDNAWKDADKAQSLGFPPPPEFMELLRKSSGRKK